jgi:hypothetical protein
MGMADSVYDIIGVLIFVQNYLAISIAELFFCQIVECILKVLQTSTDPVDNLQHLLRLPNFDKTRLVAFHLQYNKANYNNWFLPEE